MKLNFFFFFVCFFFLSQACTKHVHTGYSWWEQIKKILPNLSIISPLRGSCQRNAQGRVTHRSLCISEKKRDQKQGSHHISLWFLSFHSSPSPFTPPYRAYWVHREEEWEDEGGWKTLCIWKCPERGVIYVCIRCRFHYGPVAQVRSFQEHQGNLIRLSLITGHTGSGGELQMRGREGEEGCNRGRQKK